MSDNKECCPKLEKCEKKLKDIEDDLKNTLIIIDEIQEKRNLFEDEILNEIKNRINKTISGFN